MKSLLPLFLINLSPAVHAYSFPNLGDQATSTTRRTFWHKAALASSLTVSASTWKPEMAVATEAKTITTSLKDGMDVYRVIPDASESLSPTIQVVKVRLIVKRRKQKKMFG